MQSYPRRKMLVGGDDWPVKEPEGDPNHDHGESRMWKALVVLCVGALLSCAILHYVMIK